MMARGQKQYTEEFKKTIVELYNSGKSLAELSSEYGISKSTITGCGVRKSLKPLLFLKINIRMIKISNSLSTIHNIQYF